MILARPGRHDHTTAVCISLQSSGGLHVVQWPAGSWHGIPHWQHGLHMRSVVSCDCTWFPWFVFFFGALLWGSMIHKHTGLQEDGCDKGVHQSYLGAERNTPVIPNWFQPCQCCCCLCYSGEYLRLGTLIRYNWAQVCLFVGWCFEPSQPLGVTSGLRTWSLWLSQVSVHLFHLCVDATGVVCHQLGLLGTTLHAVGYGSFSRLSTNFASSSSSPAKPSISSAKRKLVIVLPQVLTVPSWSSKASVVIFFQKYVEEGGWE